MGSPGVGSRWSTCFGEGRELIHAPGVVCVALPGVLQGLLDLRLLPAAMFLSSKPHAHAYSFNVQRLGVAIMMHKSQPDVALCEGDCGGGTLDAAWHEASQPIKYW